MTQAVIEFELDGTIIHANDTFLSTVGYTLDEVKGRHHRMFVEPGATARATSTAQFWTGPQRRQVPDGRVQAVRQGRQGSLDPGVRTPRSLDFDGKPFKVVKYATDVTAQKLRNADFEGQLAAIGKAQAVIEFNLDGTIADRERELPRRRWAIGSTR